MASTNSWNVYSTRFIVFMARRNHVRCSQPIANAKAATAALALRRREERRPANKTSVRHAARRRRARPGPGGEHVPGSKHIRIGPTFVALAPDEPRTWPRPPGALSPVAIFAHTCDNEKQSFGPLAHPLPSCHVYNSILGCRTSARLATPYIRTLVQMVTEYSPGAPKLELILS